MLQLDLTADQLVAALLAVEKPAKLALLDSCGRTLGDSRYLIAAIYPTESFEFNCETRREAFDALQFLDKKLELYRVNQNDLQLFGGGICVATLAYEFGALFENLKPRAKEFDNFKQPAATFDFYETFVVHDYRARQTFVVGKDKEIFARAIANKNSSKSLNNEDSENAKSDQPRSLPPNSVSSNFSQTEYFRAVEEIKNHIARGDIYQANLTQQLQVQLPADVAPEQIFQRIRQQHPAPFAAFVRRKNDVVVSASPERFVQVSNHKFAGKSARVVRAAPIKGTARRGKTAEEDSRLREQLRRSPKDLAENTMIVDLLRNDIGRVCEFGSVKPVKLCEIETHETLFHLVSTIEGQLRDTVKASDLLKATFPCGSITGAPKISAMRILDRIETARRNLSMGAIGYFGFDGSMDLNVAIRTMTIQNQTAVFNVGGGIVADSEPAAEYDEAMLKALALLGAVG